MLVKEFPNLNRADEREALDVMLNYAFGDRRTAQGWGTMDPAVWQEQIDLYARARPVLRAHAEAGGGDDAGDPQGDADGRPKIG